ncbi:MAG: N-acetylmuramoyl-L-alanine amidase [Hyphomicrobiaceae bacterium]|nr:MAG: N-acetylmuramoyl-L-alanine amidase [Hyphomicrobiaceae bacterium]
MDVAGFSRGKASRRSLGPAASSLAACLILTLLPAWTTEVKPSVPIVKPGGAVVRAARIDADGVETRLTLEITRSVQFRIFQLASPNRLVLDLDNVSFRLPKDAAATSAGLIGAYRFGLLAPTRSRIVIDLKAPAKIVSSAMQPADAHGMHRLVLRLAPTDEASFLQAIERLTPPPKLRPTHHEAHVVAPPAPTAKPVIVIDPGHGGLDSGTVGTLNRAEKDVVLVFARILREQLVKSGRYRVMLTRDSDVFVSLDERVRFAREKGCHLFISLHTDSVPTRLAHLNVKGATVYTTSEKASDEEARALAEKENLSDIIAGADVSSEEHDAVNDILVDLMKRETMNSSRTFTNFVLGSLRQTTALSREPHRSAAFRVLRAPDVPSVLIELGYLSNREEEKLLLSKEWQARTARSIAQAVDAYFAKGLAKNQ